MLTRALVGAEDIEVLAGVEAAEGGRRGTGRTGLNLEPPGLAVIY